MDIVLKISIILALGLIGGKLATLVKLPNVSGYLIVGLFMGTSLLNFVTASDVKSLEILSEIALAFIAFSIGSEFVISDMIKYGKKVLVITLGEVIGAIFLVFSVMYFIFHQSFNFSIVIASMSAATAPAATLLVIRQYRAYGPLTKTILPVVALDDVFGIMAFGIAMSLTKITTSAVKPNILQIILNPLIEIFGSLSAGLVIGIILTLVLKKIKFTDEVLVVSLIAVGTGIGVAELFDLSPLLINIMIGTTIVNLLNKPERAFQSINNFTPPFYILFFTLAGASLNLSILKSIGLIGIVYVFARGVGKMSGATISALTVKAESTVTKYLGLGLLPQGGISIGLSILVRQYLPQYANEITTIIMFSILIYETFGPVFAKIAISKAKEINGMDRLGETVVKQVEGHQELQLQTSTV